MFLQAEAVKTSQGKGKGTDGKSVTQKGGASSRKTNQSNRIEIINRDVELTLMGTAKTEGILTN